MFVKAHSKPIPPIEPLIVASYALIVAGYALIFAGKALIGADPLMILIAAASP
ncbi:hypothetical protein [Bacillus sp. S3]|uniref:hypothetical protein n=1 Tax=Bacillus sp. S3 TaxID=486398 RepID=UPI001681AA15|nr:hypothetical protein [Bacillus sp. S3]